MKATRKINLLYGLASLLMVVGAIIRIGHYVTPATGFLFMLAGFLLGTITGKFYLNYLKKELTDAPIPESE